MPFNKHQSALQNFRDTLDKVENPTAEQKMLRAGLNCLLENPQAYACVNTESPFVKEFFASLPEADGAHDSCFSVFECLAVIFREKALRAPDSMSQEEKAVLEYFETSGKWPRDEHNLIIDWYWDKLPLRVLSENSGRSSYGN